MEKIPVRQLNKKNETTVKPYPFVVHRLDDLVSAKDMIQDVHRHNFYFILCLEKGNGKHSIDFVDFKVEDYAVFMLRPGQVHALHIVAGAAGCIIQFQPDFWTLRSEQSIHLLRKVSQMNAYYFSAQSYSDIKSVTDAIFSEFESKHDGFESCILSYLEVLCIHLSRNNPNKTLSNVSLFEQQRLDTFLALLETQIRQHKKVSDYAKIMRISTYQLNACAKKIVGKTASALINAQIILEAKRQLLSTSNQVNEIAYDLGYLDPSYFVRFFKRHTTETPDSFRKK